MTGAAGATAGAGAAVGAGFSAGTDCTTTAGRSGVTGADGGAAATSLTGLRGAIDAGGACFAAGALVSAGAADNQHLNSCERRVVQHRQGRAGNAQAGHDERKDRKHTELAFGSWRSRRGGGRGGRCGGFQAPRLHRAIALGHAGGRPFDLAR